MVKKLWMTHWQWQKAFYSTLSVVRAVSGFSRVASTRNELEDERSHLCFYETQAFQKAFSKGFVLAILRITWNMFSRMTTEFSSAHQKPHRLQWRELYAVLTFSTALLSLHTDSQSEKERNRTKRDNGSEQGQVGSLVNSVHVHGSEVAWKDYNRRIF